MTITDSLYGKDVFLKVGNYNKNIFEAINEAKDFITRNHCPFLNYDISGIDMMILEQLAMFDSAKVEIKKEHQLLMVSKTTSF